MIMMWNRDNHFKNESNRAKSLNITVSKKIHMYLNSEIWELRLNMFHFGSKSGTWVVPIRNLLFRIP